MAISEIAHIATHKQGARPVRTNGGFLYMRYRLLNALALALGDAFALAVAILAAGALRLWWFGEPVIPTWSWLLPLVWWGGALLGRLLPSWGLGPVEELRRVSLLLMAVFSMVAVALFLSQQSVFTSRLTLSIAFVLSLVLVPFTRMRVKTTLVKMGSWGVPTVIYGAGVTGTQVAELLEQERGLGYKLVGMFDDNPETWGDQVGNVKVLGATHLFSNSAPVAILAMPGLERQRLVELLEGPLSYYRTVMLIPDLFEIPSLWVRPRDLSGILGLEITSNLVSPLAQFVKRTVDILVTLVLAPLWVPLCLLLALLIRLEDGHASLFRQVRMGLNGQAFQTIKFRTMVPNAEDVLQKRLAEDAALRREWNTTYKLKKDPRVTRVGRVLRRLSLDELPQLVNVLRGEMSLVGPRPLPPYHEEDLDPRVRALRERTRPGLTGLWQVSGRSDVGTAGMERWDAYYVRNWSMWLDVVILIRTLRVVYNGTGAY